MTRSLAAVFVSDVHLSAHRPAPARAFLALLDDLRHRTRALYLLGDVFDAWLGDDDEQPLHAAVAGALDGLSRTGTAVRLMHGNHDFLIADGYAARCGASLLDDPAVVSVGGRAVLLSHGDIYCTDDTEYQAFRRWSREPANQQAFLDLPLEARARQAAALQERSRASTRLKAADIMDVNADAVADAFREHATDVLVHGHTHRPAVHRVDVDGRRRRRYVLGDWYETEAARVLLWPARGEPMLIAPAAVAETLATEPLAAVRDDL